MSGICVKSYHFYCAKTNIIAVFFLLFVVLFSCSLNCPGEEKTIPSKESSKAFFEGYDLLQKGHMEKAIPFLELAIKQNPLHAPAYSKLADCYEKMGDYQKAAHSGTNTWSCVRALPAVPKLTWRSLTRWWKRKPF